MKYRFDDFEYRGLDPEAAWLRRYRELREAAYIFEDGKVVGIRNLRLSEQAIEFGMLKVRVVAARAAEAYADQNRTAADKAEKKTPTRMS